ncbi:potassium channel family protein [Mesorhizobium sp. YIM 152430]|uniref:potassium channel family protein n=1 Tax=Mesorhizobium sp. YIM 152430 TaxID=3031761 RepID=UPI0023DBACFB|nr:potassium channel family protein [Mesorhizobium sp. YIM 152430]MDF1600206.1 potassium channel family protein [Mesorhizobium sp. YIM 152430]
MSPINKAVMASICFAALVAVVESEVALHDGKTTIFSGVEIVLTTIFAIEYLARVWIAAEDCRYRGARGRVRYMLKFTSLIDLFALLPLFLGFLGSEAFLLRLFRLIRIMRLAKLGRFSKALMAIIDALRDRKYELAMSVVIASVLLLVSSTLLYIVEGDGQQGAFGSIPRAMWWSIATLTTVGYGDVVPLTGIGRILSGATALLGIGLIAMPTGILASAFSDALQRERQRKSD